LSRATEPHLAQSDCDDIAVQDGRLPMFGK